MVLIYLKNSQIVDESHVMGKEGSQIEISSKNAVLVIVFGQVSLAL